MLFSFQSWRAEAHVEGGWRLMSLPTQPPCPRGSALGNDTCLWKSGLQGAINLNLDKGIPALGQQHPLCKQASTVTPCDSREQ